MEQRLIEASFVLYTVALCLIPLMPSVWLLFIPTAIYGVAQGSTSPTS